MSATMNITATHASLPSGSTTYALPRSSTISELKLRVCETLGGRSGVDGVVCVLGGRVCRDSEVLGELWEADGTLQIILKPDGRPVLDPLPLLTPTAGSSYTPVFLPPLETPLPTASTSTASLDPVLPSTARGYSSYIAFVAQLIPLQRSLLLLNLQKAHFFYGTAVQDRLGRLGWANPTPVVPLERLADESDAAYEERVEASFGEVELKEVEDLLIGCGLWETVLEKEGEADVEVANWTPARADPNGEFQVVQIGGLPFMLQLPPAYLAPSNAPPPLLLYRSLKRAQAILLTLTTMLQLLITYQPTAPSIAYGRALLRQAPRAEGGLHGVGRGFADIGGGARVREAGEGVAAGADGAPIVRGRRATLSIVINVEAIVSLILPLFLLSLKLGFLLWIFGRHASSTKRAILFAMAVGWVIWEGYQMHRRRFAIPRERAERERRRAAAALQPVGIPMPRAPPAPVPHAAAPHHPAPNAPPPVAAPVVHPTPVAPAIRIREPTSRLTPRYWLNWIAAVGLASEARELGLVPRSIAGRPIVNPPRRAPNPNDRSGVAAESRRRALRTAMVGIVLFFGTMISPEIERKRRRALEKRERLLAARKATRERKRAVAEAAAVAAATLATSTSSTLLPPPPAIDPSLLPPPAGRGVVSDAELFADGLGEPDQSPLLPDSATMEGAGVDGLDSDEEERREREAREGDGAAVDEVAALF